MIRLATVEDAPLIHKIMLSAFEEYKNSHVPSGALNETVTSIEEALKKGSKKHCFTLRTVFQLVL